MTRLWVIAVLTVGAVMACDKVPLTSPTGSTIVLSIDKDIIPLGGTAQVTAVVTESAGTAVQNGTTVSFSTSLGRIEPIEAQTVNGKATVTFMAGTTSGTAAISAFSGAARTGSGNSSAGGVSIKVGAAGADKITVHTEPATISQTGGTVTIIANVTDAGGNPLPGAPVNFSVDNGTLSANAANTDASGEARVQLTTNRATKVTATVGSKTVDFNVTVLAAPTVSVGSCTSSPVVGVAVTCTVTPTVAANGSPIQNVTVNWGDGTGDVNLGTISSATTTSHTYTRADTFTVTATATDVAGQVGRGTASVALTRSIPSISISAGSSTGTVGTPINFTITPPASPSVPITGVVVDFGDGTTRNLGTITAGTTISKTYSSAGNYTVSATVTDLAGTRNTASTAVTITAAAAPTITLTETSTNLSSGCGNFSVTANVASGSTATITSVRVYKQGTNTEYYSGTSGGTFAFAACGLTANDILVGTATDSLNTTASVTLLVK